MRASSDRSWRRSNPPPKWVGAVIGMVVLAIYRPLSKLFGRRWPRVVSRFMTRYLAEFPRDYRPTAHDVFVCSYFKSGTNWTMQLAVQVAHRGRAEYEHIHDLVAWPDMSLRAGFAVPLSDEGPQRVAPTGLRVIKTHLKLDPVPFSRDARYICVVRDPKDVFVSSYHFTRAMVMGSLMPSVEGWLDAYLSPDTALGSWAQHVACYWKLRDEPNVLFMTYESMRADLPGTVDRIAALLGVALTDEERAAVIERSSFAHMKSIGHKFDAPGAPWASSAGAMMRKGESGASGEMLTAEQQRRIDDFWQAELAALGCDFPYADAFGREPERRAA
jgi:hypothetical protein